MIVKLKDFHNQDNYADSHVCIDHSQSKNVVYNVDMPIVPQRLYCLLHHKRVNVSKHDLHSLYKVVEGT